MMLKAEAQLLAQRIPLDLPHYNRVEVVEGGLANGEHRWWVECYHGERNPRMFTRSLKTYYSIREFAEDVYQSNMAHARNTLRGIQKMEWTWIFAIMQFTLLRYRHWSHAQVQGKFYFEVYGERAVIAAVTRDVRQKFQPLRGKDFAKRHYAEGPGWGKRVAFTTPRYRRTKKGEQ
jgi:hypothetical protein